MSEAEEAAIEALKEKWPQLRLPSKMEFVQMPRRVEVSSHGEFWAGMFHRWSTKDGLVYAIIEKENGEVVAVAQPSEYSLKFAERRCTSLSWSPCHDES